MTDPEAVIHLRPRLRGCLVSVPHRWSLAAAIILGLAVHAWAQADTAPPKPDNQRSQAASQLRQGQLVASFGNWEIRKGLIDNTYLLIGESNGEGEGHFWLHCDQNNMITVAVPLADYTGREGLRSHAITIRADTGAKRALDLVVFESLVAVALDYSGGRNDKITDFIDVLRAAKETVTISYAHRTFAYDVTQLPAAQARFLGLCRETRSH
jgi:hypothetical protein